MRKEFKYLKEKYLFPFFLNTFQNLKCLNIEMIEVVFQRNKNK
jgi:hypothetical protein